MKLLNATLALALGVFGLFSAVSPGFAATRFSTYDTNAVSRVSLNVRAGPSTRYRVVDVLYPGERVQVNTCRAGWCYIVHPGPDGWVSARYLRSSAPPPPTYTPPPPPPPPPPSYPFPTRPAPVDPWPGPPVPWPFHPWPGNPVPPDQPRPDPWPSFPAKPEYQVCFYDGQNFTGARTCTFAGQYIERLEPRWDNRISSIQVFNRTSVTICRDADFEGQCRTFNTNQPRLGNRFNNQVSSIKVD